PPPEVTAPTSRVVEGVTTHHSRGLDDRDRMTWNRIPVTTPARTLADLAAVLPEPELARAVHEAAIRHNTTPDEVEAVLARRPKTSGAGTLRKVLRGESPVLLSKLEREFRKLLDRAGLPLPITNRREGGFLVDGRWPAYKLTVELDGYRYHASRHA